MPGQWRQQEDIAPLPPPDNLYRVKECSMICMSNIEAKRETIELKRTVDVVNNMDTRFNGHREWVFHVFFNFVKIEHFFLPFNDRFYDETFFFTNFLNK